MNDPVSPLLILSSFSCQMSDEEIQREIDANFTLNKSVDRLLSGTISPGELINLIESYGVDSEDYVNRVEHNINKAINQRMEFDPNEVKIYLP